MREYNAYTSTEWAGVKVEAVTPLRNGYITIPVGTILTIERKRAGFSLNAPQCQCCGVAPHISSVEPRHLRVVEEGGTNE